MAAPLYHTADMVRALTGETRHWPRYETVHGELLVTPAPRPWHQSVALRLARTLGEYLDREHVGEVFMSPADISGSGFARAARRLRRPDRRSAYARVADNPYAPPRR